MLLFECLLLEVLLGGGGDFIDVDAGCLLPFLKVDPLARLQITLRTPEYPVKLVITPVFLQYVLHIMRIDFACLKLGHHLLDDLPGTFGPGFR